MAQENEETKDQEKEKATTENETTEEQESFSVKDLVEVDESKEPNVTIVTPQGAKEETTEKKEEEKTSEATDEEKEKSEVEEEEEIPWTEDMEIEDNEEAQPVSNLEHLTKLNDLFTETLGFSYNEYIAFKDEDINKWEEEEVLREHLKFQNPGLSDANVEKNMQARFDLLFMDQADLDEKIESGSVTQREIAQQEAAWADELAKGRSTLLNGQKKMIDSYNNSQLDYEFTNQTESNQSTEQAIQEAAEQEELLLNAIHQDIDGYEKETFKFKDEDGQDLFEIEYDVADDSREGLKDLAKNLFGRWKTKDGNIDIEAYNRDMLIINDFDKIGKVIYDQAKSTGREDQVKRQDNINFKEKTKESTPPREVTQDDVLRQIAADIRH